MNALMPRLSFLLVLPALCLVGSASAQTVEFFDWDGGAGDNLWRGIDLSGPSPAFNWSPESFPAAEDSIRLTSASLDGPVTISLNGATESVTDIQAQGVGGVYTFANGTLRLGDATNTLFTDDLGGGLVIDADIEFDNSAGATQRFNVDFSGQPIVVNGDVSTVQASGITTLMLTSRNDNLAQSVTVGGVISDGAGRVQLAAGLTSDLGNHTGVVRLTGANTFTGSVGVNAAILEFDSIENVGGPANALGQAPLADSVIFLGNNASAGGNRATLRYVGSGHTSDRVLRLTGGNNAGGVVESSGTGPLVLTGGVTTDGSGQSFRLGGTNTDDNEFSGTIEAPASGNVTSFIKEGPGKWILSGNSPGLDNSFIIDGGELVVRGAIGGGEPNVFSIDTRSGATLTLDGGSITARGIRNAGAIAFRAGTIRLNGSSSTAGGTFAVGTGGSGTLALDGGTHPFDEITLDGADDRIEFNGGTASFNELDNSAGGTIVSNSTAAIVTINTGFFTDRVNAGTRQFAARLTGSGGYVKRGAGTIEFTQSSQSTFTGETRILEGTLDLTGQSGLPVAPIFIAGGATLRVADAAGGDDVGTLSGAGTIETGLGASISAGGTSGTALFAGSINGTGGLIKRRAGTQVLAGASTYTGTTALFPDGGTLRLDPGGSIVGTSGVTYSGNTTLEINGGTLDTPGNVETLANSAELVIRSGLLKANAIDRTVNSQYLSDVTWTGGTVHLLSPITITNGLTAVNRPFPGTLALDDDMTLINEGVVTVAGNGALLLDGGTVEAEDVVLSSNGRVEFNSGTMRLGSDQTLNAARLQQLDITTPLLANRTLVIDGSATVEAPLVLAGGTLSASQVVNPGELILAGGTLEVTGGDLAIAAGEVVDATSGMTIDVTAGALINDGELNAINADLSFSAGIVNNGQLNLINSTVDGDLVNGTTGSATLLGSNTFGDDLDLSATSSLILGIDSAIDFEQVVVGGDAAVDGVLNVSLGDGFTPAAGQQFALLTAASVVDEGLTLVGAAAGQFDLLVTGSSVVLQATGGLAGDYNADGVVNAADYTVWRDGLGTTFSQADYGVWAANYGATLPVNANAVPEPSTALLIALAGAAGLGRRGWRS